MQQSFKPYLCKSYETSKLGNGNYFLKLLQENRCSVYGTRLPPPFPSVLQTPACILFSESEVAQLCPTLCDPMDCSLPGSSIRGILQARILEWVAIPILLTQESNPGFPHCRQILYHLSHQGRAQLMVA